MDWEGELKEHEASVTDDELREAMMESHSDVVTPGGTVLGLPMRDAIAFVGVSVLFGFLLGAHALGWW